MSGTAPSDAAEAPNGLVPPSGGGGSGFLSDVLVELGFASRETVEEAVRAAASPGMTVAGVLVESGAITEDQLARATAERHGIHYVDLGTFRVDPGAANLIKPAAARRYRAVPVAHFDGGLLVAMADPGDTLAASDIAATTKLEVRPAAAARPALEGLLEALPLEEGGWAPEPGPAADAEPAPEPDLPEAAPDPATEPDPAPEPEPRAGPASAGDASRLRGELDALKRQLAGAEAKLREGRQPAEQVAAAELRARLAAAEAELEEGRVRLREAKEVGAELESLREKLQAAEEGLGRAGARAREGEALAAEAEKLRVEVTGLRHERDELRSELRRATADAEVRGGELESLRTRLTAAETELVRVRAEADARSVEVEAMRSRSAGAERDAEQALRRATDAEERADEARRRAFELEREAATAHRLAEELSAAEERADQARRALTRAREDAERERERAAMAERDLHARLADEERRRGELERRLAEVEGAALAVERSFEELRLAQERMRAALATAAGSSGTAARTP